MKLTLFLDFGTIGFCAIVFFLLWLFITKERRRQNTSGQILLQTALTLSALLFLLTVFNVSVDIFQRGKNIKLLEEEASNSNKKKRELMQKITLLENQLKTVMEEKDTLTTHRDSFRAKIRQSCEDIAQIRELISSLATHKVAKTSVSLPSDFSPQEAHVKVRFPKDEEIKNQLLEKIEIISDRFNKILD